MMMVLLTQANGEVGRSMILVLDEILGHTSCIGVLVSHLSGFIFSYFIVLVRVMRL